MRQPTIARVSETRRVRNLRTILDSRRAELLDDLRDRLRAARSDGIADRDVIDDAESSELGTQEDIAFALIQLKTEMLSQIDAALRRLESGTYGDCVECGDEIAEARLRALLFAVRCRDCEHSREAAGERERVTQRRGPSPLP